MELRSNPNRYPRYGGYAVLLVAAVAVGACGADSYRPQLPGRVISKEYEEPGVAYNPCGIIGRAGCLPGASNDDGHYYLDLQRCEGEEPQTPDDCSTDRLEVTEEEFNSHPIGAIYDLSVESP